MSGQVKGAQLLTTIKALRREREWVRQNLPAELHHYLDERIVMSLWYPETDYRSLLHALGRLLEARVHGSVWREIGEAGARTDSSGVYATLMREDDPAGTLVRCAQAWSLHHDQGRVLVSSEGTRARVEIHDYEVMDASLAEVNAGYVCGLLRAVGAKDVEARVVDVPPAQVGPTVIEVSWS